MRLRHKKNAENDILIHPFVINTKVDNNFVPENKDAKYNNNNTLMLKHLNIDYIFGNNKPIYIELGMGKGKFITEMSLKYPEINFIGIEKSATIVLKAIDNLSNYADFNSKTLLTTFPNLRFMCEDIINIENIFNPESIDKIFLNFSDPWPKKRHESRRLTHQRFLSIYEKLLKNDSLIEFKTDNIDLFNFSLEEIKNSNFKLLEFTFDLHNDNKLNIDNIMTEYEYKFSSKGNKICKLIARK